MRIAALDALAARRPVFGQSDALEVASRHTFVGDDVAGIELDLDLVFGFADFDAAADPDDGNRVAAGMERNVAFDIDDAFVQPVDFRDPDRQRLQMRLLESKQLARDGADMFLVGAVDPVAPLAGLRIEILPAGEGASGEESYSR